jgi:YihY family inner membrane protein
MLGRIPAILWLASCRYAETDGELRAASFAYYAIFALFPLILLFITIGSLFVDPMAAANRVVDVVDKYMPVDPELRNVVMGTVLGVAHGRRGAGLVAVLGLAWSSLRFFQSLVRGVNRAWHTNEIAWWHMPFKNLKMVGIVASALLIGVIAPVIVDAIEAEIWSHSIPFGAFAIYWIFQTVRWLVPPLVLFYGFSLFYTLAPHPLKRFADVWVAAVIVTLSLRGLQTLFVLYAKNYAKFNALYGALGGVVALLMWIYLSGSIIIFCACISAAQAEMKAAGRADEARTAVSGLAK